MSLQHHDLAALPPTGDHHAPPPPYQDTTTADRHLDSTPLVPDEKLKVLSAAADPDDDAFSHAESEELDSTPTLGSKSYHIDAAGTNGCCFGRSSALTTNVLNMDGSPAYTSTRHSRSSGSCVLAHAARGDLLSTTYKFGPGRAPQMHYFTHGAGPSDAKGGAWERHSQQGEGIAVDSGWVSRAAHFTAPTSGRVLEWRYSHAKDKDRMRSQLIVLGDKGAAKGARPLAMLVRNKNTRAAGSRRSTAGNGGELVINAGCEEVVAEELVVASCLCMLKKEVDRRKSQMMAGPGAVVVVS